MRWNLAVRRHRGAFLMLGLLVAIAVPAVLGPMVAGRPASAVEALRDEEPAAAKAEAAGDEFPTYTPLPAWFKFQSKDTVNGWVADSDVKSMTEHAWEIWGGLTTLTKQVFNGQKMPIYETWYDRNEALSPPQTVAPRLRGARRIRNFELPKQLIHTGALARQHQRLERALAATALRPLLSFFDNVKYTEEIRKEIQDNKYYDGATLQKINDGWGITPIADRNLKDFPDTSVMLKPTYVYASGSQPTLMGYWSGPANSATPDTPGPGSWTSQMWVVPPGFDPSNFDNKSLQLISLDRFFALKLTQDEIDAIKKASPQRLPADAKAGDYMVLVAMHVSTREIDNWTWQTFWWSYSKPTIPSSVRSRVSAPFDNYQVAVGYSFLTAPGNPDSLNLVCFNPYLEAGFDNSVFAKPKQLGIESNCMSCHRCAAWPANNASYIANGEIEPCDSFFFTNNTKTDFLWGIPFGVNPP